jgi:hypothetical protein
MGTSSGKTVSVFLGGLDCGDYVVAADGSVVVLYGSDPDGLLTAAYLHTMSNATTYGNLGIQLDVTISAALTRVVVPCVIGYSFTSAGETCRPLTQDDAKSPMGPTLGKTRSVKQFGALLQGTVGGTGGLAFRSGTNGIWYPAQLHYPNETAYNHATLFNGVHWDTIDGDTDFDGVISWQVTRPYPVTICGISGFLETRER